MGLTPLVFFAAFVIGCSLAFIRHPIYGLVTYVAVYYLDPPSRWWGVSLPGLRWSLLTALVVLFAYLVRRGRRRPTIPLFQHRVMPGLMIFFAWIAIQSFWVLDWGQHLQLLTLMAKYLILVALIYLCIETEQHLRMFLWAHVMGCVYLGWIVFTTYHGGRFEGFGGADINEANAGALQILTGVFTASALFLDSGLRGKITLFCAMPLMINAVVATVSRSGFLELAVGGVIFNLLVPPGVRLRVRVLSVLAVVLFAMLTNPMYWMRISTIQDAGERIQGVDTGAGRLDLIRAQWRMFKEYPLGCGHRCTAVLSRDFLPDSELTGVGANRARSSHNTFMTLLVEHGVPGALLYLLLILWLIRRLRQLARACRGQEGLLPILVPAVAAMIGALFVGDLFVDYLILEVRMWLIAIVMVMTELALGRARSKATASTAQQLPDVSDGPRTVGGLIPGGPAGVTPAVRALPIRPRSAPVVGGRETPADSR